MKRKIDYQILLGMAGEALLWTMICAFVVALIAMWPEIAGMIVVFVIGAFFLYALFLRHLVCLIVLEYNHRVDKKAKREEEALSKITNIEGSNHDGH